MKNGLDEQYIDLLKDILENGIEKQTRNGKTLSVFGRTIRYKFKDGKFPLLTTKKMYFKGIVTELLWFLRGETNIKYLVDNDCHIWDGDAYKNYLIEDAKILPNMSKEKMLEFGFRLTKDEFILNIKTDNEFAKKWGELGPIYGKQWRSWTKKKMYLSTDGSYENIYDEADQTVIDQISVLINELKTNPDSRRMVVSAWAVHDLPNMVLPPCHYGFQVYTRELGQRERLQLLWKVCREKNIPANSKELDNFWLRYNEIMNKHNIPTRAISLMWNQRSVDFGLGAPFNIASYGLLLGIIAKEVNMVPDELIGNLGDVHLYLDHIEPIKEQLNREPYPLPTLNIFEPAIGKEISILDNLHIWSPTCFIIENYQSHPTIKLSLSN